MKARPYQFEAAAAVIQCWLEYQSVLAVLATGLGKTFLAAMLAVERSSIGRTMFLAHREELVWQAAETMTLAFGQPPQVEMADFRAEQDMFSSRSNVVISSVQTQYSGMGGKGRMTKFDPAEFGTLVIDECFPGNTLIDGVPIDAIAVGDHVQCFNEATGTVERRKVLAVSKRKARSLLRIWFADGRSIVCTPAHPIYLQGFGFMPAQFLQCGSMALTISDNENDQADLRNLSGDVQGIGAERIGEGAQRRGGEAGNVFDAMQETPSIGNDGGDKSSARIGADVGAQSHEARGDASESVNDAARHGLEAANAGRKWKRSDSPTNVIGERAGMGNGNRNQNRSDRRSVVGTANLLQGGHRKSNFEDRSRSGRQQPSRKFTQGSGCEENGRLATVGVASIEVLQPGSDAEFESVCSDGYVYNIEVEEHHNYFAGGVLVHNCHHYIAPSYRRVVDYYMQNPNLRVLGITATPDRADKLAMGRLFKAVAYNYGIRPGIDDGWLVNVDQWTGTISGIDLSEVGTVAGDLNADQLAQVMERNGNVYGVADRTLARVGDRRSLVFAASINHARLLAAIFNDRKPGSAKFVCKDTPTDERRLMLAEYARNEFQFLCNVGVATEGFNDPGIECVVVARPTKSRSLYTQMIGRGTRTLPGVVDQYETADDRKISIAESAKPAVEVIDYVGNAGRHKLVTTMDILGGDYETEVIERARQMCMDAAKAINVDTALEFAKAEMAERRRAEAAEASRQARLRVTAQCDYEQVDPFSHAGSNVNPDRRTPAQARSRPATEAMQRFLDKHGPKGVDAAEMTIGDAGKLIGEIRRRWTDGLCSIDQDKLLRAKGLPGDVPKETARAWIEEMKRNSWKVTPNLRAQAAAFQSVMVP